MADVVMSVDRKHFYRFGYLKSEHWHGLRIVRLAKSKARCKVCGHQSWDNDVHHLTYRNLYDVTVSDLRVLCRSCHDEVHLLMRLCPYFYHIKSAGRRWKYLRRKRRDYRRRVKLHGPAAGLIPTPLPASTISYYNLPTRKLFQQAKRRIFGFVEFPTAWAITQSRIEMPWHTDLFRWHFKFFGKHVRHPADHEWLAASQQFGEWRYWPNGEH